MFDTHDDVVRRFADASGAGDVVALTAVLAPHAVAVCDGGGRVSAPAHPVHGAEDVAVVVHSLLSAHPDAVLAVEAVNGRTGLVLRRAGEATAVVSVIAVDGRAAHLWIVLNPDKLRGWHHG